jgi:hypothetical protein
LPFIIYKEKYFVKTKTILFKKKNKKYRYLL